MLTHTSGITNQQHITNTHIMKKILLLVLSFLLLQVSPIFACEICGCSNGSSFYGILPQSHKGFVGLRYSYRSYDSHLSSPTLKSKEDFWKAELWARAYPFKKVQVFAFVPYLMNQQTILSTGKKLNLNGLGDITLLANYNLLNTLADTSVHRFNHNLLIGGGVKLPIAKYQFDVLNDAEVANANFQLGTGSTDFIANVVYTLRYQAWGLNYDATYKINTQNAETYQFGNRFTTNLSVLYSKNIGDNLTLMPNAGVSYEHAQLDRKYNIRNAQTGGYTSWGNLGLESYYKGVSMGVNYQIPLKQNLSEGEQIANARLNVHFTVML